MLRSHIWPNPVEMLLFLIIKHYILWKIRAATYFLSTSNSYDQNPRTNTSTPPKKNLPLLRYRSKISPDCHLPGSAS